MNFQEGKILIDGEIISPGYTFNDFKKTHFYENQDGIRIIKLKNPVIIDKHKYIINLFFKNYILYMITLVCIDKDIPFEKEEERFKLHEKIMSEYGLSMMNTFNWGNIKLKFDPRSNLSSINIIYNAGC